MTGLLNLLSEIGAKLAEYLVANGYEDALRSNRVVALNTDQSKELGVEDVVVIPVVH